MSLRYCEFETVTLFDQHTLNSYSLTIFTFTVFGPQFGMRIIFIFLILRCTADLNRITEIPPRCYRCIQYTMEGGQDFIKKEKNDQGQDLNRICF